MAKRTIIECDLTKQEIGDDDTVFTLKVAKKGTRTNMTYELSSAAAEALLAQLNGRKELREGWQFSSPGDMPVRPPGVRDGTPRRRTLGDLDDEGDDEEEPEDDSRFVAEKKASLREAGVLDEESDETEERQQDGPVAKAVGANRDKCIHMNKGRVQVTMRGGKRYVYRKCADCREDIPEMTSEARQQYMSGKAPKGVRIRDL